MECPRGERAPPALPDRRPSAFLRTIADRRIARTESQVNHRHGRSSRTARPRRTEVEKRERKECRGARTRDRSFGAGLLTPARRLCYHVGACQVANVSRHRPRSRLGGTGKSGDAASDPSPRVFEICRAVVRRKGSNGPPARPAGFRWVAATSGLLFVTGSAPALRYGRLSGRSDRPPDPPLSS